MSEAPEKLQNYELIRKLASGGMAEVFLAKQKSVGGFERLVCVKRILPHLSEEHDFITMFHDEARIVANFNHPNIAQIIEIGTEDGHAFIAMEFIDGEDLRHLYNAQAKLGEAIPAVYAAHIVQGVAAGLDYAHARTDIDGEPLGVVHRDISPQNILVSHDGHVKIIDFGVAKAANKASETRVGVLKGKYAYMSPEQAMGDPLDGRTDVFALGIILFEITTGTRLFKRQNELETLHAVIECEILSPSSIVPSYDPALEAILLKSLAHDPNDRFQRAGEFESALQGYLVGKNYHPRPASLASYLSILKHSQDAPPDDTSDMDGTITNVTLVAEDSSMTQLANAAEGLLQEPSDTETPMAFEDSPTDSGTLVLREDDIPTAPPSLPNLQNEATVVVNRPMFQNEITQDPDATVVKRVPRRVKPPSQKKKIMVAVLSTILGVMAAGTMIYYQRSLLPPPLVMSGPVIIETKPAGARVIFAGRRAGEWNARHIDETTPLVLEEGLPSDGSWSITLKKDGFENVAITLPRLDPAPVPATITIPLRIVYEQHLRGTVSVLSEPSGATVRVDGEDLTDTTPLQHLPTEANKPHEVELVLAGYLPHYETFTIAPDSHVTIRIKLEKKDAQLRRENRATAKSEQAHTTSGYLTVRAPMKMRVFIDGELAGVTPLKRRTLPVGPHTVELRNEHLGLSSSRKTRIRAGSTSLIQVSRKKGFLSLNAKPWAKVTVGRQNSTDTPRRLMLYEGEYKLRFECPDGSVKNEIATVVSGQTTPVVVTCQIKTP